MVGALARLDWELGPKGLRSGSDSCFANCLVGNELAFVIPSGTRRAGKGDMNAPYDSSLQPYLAEIHQHPRLGPEKETDLAHRIHAGDEGAKWELIAANLRLVVFLAREVRHPSMSLGDLVAEGNLGLIRAAEKYQPDRGARFGTYAAIWIRQAMRAACVRQGQTIRIPAHAMAKVSKLAKLRSEWRERWGREASTAELARATGLSLEEIAHLQTMAAETVSLDASVGTGDDSRSLEESMGDERAEAPDATCARRDLREHLSEWLGDLSPREREVMELRYGLSGNPQSLEQVGRKYGITRERVRQLQEVATRKLRRAWIRWEGASLGMPSPAAA